MNWPNDKANGSGTGVAPLGTFDGAIEDRMETLPFENEPNPAVSTLNAPQAPTNGNTISNIRLLIALDEYAEAGLVQRAFDNDGPHNIYAVNWCRDGSRLYKEAVDFDADAVLVDPNIPNFDARDLNKLLFNEKKPIVTIGAVDPRTDMAKLLKRVGVANWVERPITDETIRRLVGIINAAVQDALRHRASASYIPQLDATTTQAIVTRGWKQASVAVWAPKGGVGKTTVSVNLAVALGVIAGRETALVDANMAGGNALYHCYSGLAHFDIANNISALAASAYAVSLHGGNALSPSNDRAGLLNARPILPPSEIQKYLHPFQGSKLGVLLGIPKQHMSGLDHFQARQGEQGRVFIRELLTNLRQFKDFVILDVGQDANNEVHLAALQFADVIYVVVTPDRASVESTKHGIDILLKVGSLNRSKFRLVINRFDPANGLARKDIVNYLGLMETAVIPDGGPAVSAQLNRGVPLVLGSSGEIAAEYIRLASTLYSPITDIWAHRKKLGRTPNQDKPLAKALRAIFG